LKVFPHQRDVVGFSLGLWIVRFRVHDDIPIDLSGVALLTQIMLDGAVCLNAISVLPDQAPFTLYHESFIHEHAADAPDDVFFILNTRLFTQYRFARCNNKFTN
jgi:hypothetical protein